VRPAQTLSAEGQDRVSVSSPTRDLPTSRGSTAAPAGHLNTQHNFFVTRAVKLTTDKRISGVPTFCFRTTGILLHDDSRQGHILKGTGKGKGRGRVLAT